MIHVQLKVSKVLTDRFFTPGKSRGFPGWAIPHKIVILGNMIFLSLFYHGKHKNLKVNFIVHFVLKTLNRL